jgi:hypothetical protein
MHQNISVYNKQDALFAFSLLQLTAFTCFEHLFAHHQEVLYIQRSVYLCVYYVSWLLAGFVHTVPPHDEQISGRYM